MANKQEVLLVITERVLYVCYSVLWTILSPVNRGVISLLATEI